MTRDFTATWFSDTDPKALQVFVDIHRQMSVSERLRQVFDLSDFNRKLQLRDVKIQHPDADEREVFLRVAARSLDRELMLRAYGWAPEE